MCSGWSNRGRRLLDRVVGGEQIVCRVKRRIMKEYEW